MIEQISPIQLGLALVGAAAIISYLLYRTIQRKAATQEEVLGTLQAYLLESGDLVAGVYSLAERIWTDIAFINRMAAERGLTEEQLKSLRRNMKFYGVRDKATRALRDRTLLMSTQSLAPESPYVKAIRSEELWPGKVVNVYMTAGPGERLGTVGDWNIAWISPLNVRNPSRQSEGSTISFDGIKNLGELAAYSRQAAHNISEIKATKQQVEDRTDTVDKLVKENLSLRDQVNILKTVLAKKPLRQVPEVAVEAVGRGNILWYAVAAVAGYFVGSNISQTFTEPQTLGTALFVAFPLALWYFFFRKKAVGRV